MNEIIIAPTNTPEKLDPDDLRPVSPLDPEFPTTLPPVRLETEYPLNILPERQQAKALGKAWDVRTVRAVNNHTGIFFQMPMICKGDAGCPIASVCTVSNRNAFIGKSCPLEILELFKHFQGYVKGLDIEADDYIDLQMVADLCRLQLILWRTDQTMRLQTEVQMEVGVVAQKTGDAYHRQAINQNRALQQTTRAGYPENLRGFNSDPRRKRKAKTERLF